MAPAKVRTRKGFVKTPPPRINALTNNTAFTFRSGVQDFRILGLHFYGNGVGGSRGFYLNSGSKQNLVQRIESHNYHGGAYSRDGAEEFTIADCHIYDGNGGGGGNLSYVGGKKIALLGNRFANSTNTEHVLRVHNAQRIIIDNNEFIDPASSKHNIKFHSSTDPNEWSELAIISNNSIVGSTNDWLVGLGPASAGDSHVDENVRDIIVEKNTFKGLKASNIALLLWGNDITVRNNIFLHSGGTTAIEISKRVTNHANALVPERIRIYHNTSANKQFIQARDFKDLEAYNNIWHLPNLTGTRYFIATPDAASVSELRSDNNLFLRDSSPGAILFRDYPEKRPLTEWQNTFGLENNSLESDSLLINFGGENYGIQSASPAKNNGKLQVPVFDDYQDHARNQSTNVDIGAYELDSSIQKIDSTPPKKPTTLQILSLSD